MTVKVSKPAINVREELADLKKPTGIAGEAMLRAESVAEQAALLGFQPKNIFINGDQRIWQRGTTQTGHGASTELVVSDRWRNYQSGSTGRCTWSQDTDAPDGHEYSAKLQVTTADTSVGANHRWNIAYRMETDDFKQMGFGTTQAVGFTVQFWVKSNKTGTYSCDPYVNNSIPTCKRNFTIEAEDVWQQVVLTFPPSSVASGNDPSFWIWLQAGSDYTDDRGETWTGSTDGRAHGQTVNLYDSTSNYIKITGIQMVRGEYPTGLPFERRSYGEELALCQRYTYVIGGAGVTTLGGGSMYTSTAVNIDVPLPVQMRGTSPSLTSVANGTGNWLNVYVGATGTVSNATPQLGDNIQANLRIYATNAHSGSSPSAAGAAIWCMVLAGAKLIISEEL